MECPICLEIITEKKNIKKTICGHKFCKECINEWMEQEESCPLCRKELKSVVVINIEGEREYATMSIFGTIHTICSTIICMILLIFLIILVVSFILK